MLNRSRHLFLSLLGALLASACNRAGGGARACSTDDQCSGLCRSGGCVDNTPPIAAVAPPGGLLAHDLATFDGSASSDADDGDAVATYDWTFTAVDAPCAAPVVADRAALARVRFACAGRFKVSLVVTDSKRASSEPAERALVVAERTGAAPVTVSGDVVSEHRCAGGTCSLLSPVALSASVRATSSGAVRYHWTAVAPADRALGADRRVRFDPGPEVAAPSVSIDTDGTAITGDWLFQVEALDAAGSIGTGTVRVSVTGRPPEVQASLSQPVDHAFVAAGPSFTATGRITGVVITDPDGDAIAERKVTFDHSGDGDGTFTGIDHGDSIEFSIAVPYRSPLDAGFLIGAVVHRAVVITAKDVNGAEVRREIPIQVANRPPVLTVAATAAEVPHAYDASRRQYVAWKALGRWTDPDGDPIVGAISEGDPDCATFAGQADGSVTATCSRPFAGAPPTGFFATHRFRYWARDPFAPAASPETTAFGIGNRSPTLTTSSPVVETMTCDAGSCCVPPSSGICTTGYEHVTRAQVIPFTPEVSDPDGDPVWVWQQDTASSSAVLCQGGACPSLSLAVPSVRFCGVWSESNLLSLRITDGDAVWLEQRELRQACK
jgi:hypothetical protein